MECASKVDEVRDEGIKLSEMGNYWKILSRGFYTFFIPSYYVLHFCSVSICGLISMGAICENADLRVTY